MTRIRSISLLAAGACMVLACSKGGSGGGGGGGGGGGAAGSALDVLPKETGAVLGFSINRFRETSFYTMLMESLPAESKTKLQEVKDTCGIDGLNDLESVVVAGPASMDKNHMVILVKGKWNEDKISKCATAMAPKMNKKVTVAKEGNITTYSVEGQPPASIGWVGDLMVITPGAMEGDKTYLTELLKPKGTVKDNKPFMDLINKCDTGATVWAAALASEGELGTMLQRMTGGAEKPAGIWLTLKLSKSLDASAGLRMQTDADAKAVAERATKELEGAKKDPNAGPYLQSAGVTQSGADVNVKLALDEKQMQQLTDMAKQMAPMLKAMMGG